MRLQWVPSYVGTLGNEMAASLADETLLVAPSIKDPQDEKTVLKDQWCPSHQPFATKEANRSQATLLHRVRMGSTRTPAWVQRKGLPTSPLCASSGVRGNNRTLRDVLPGL